MFRRLATHLRSLVLPAGLLVLALLLAGSPLHAQQPDRRAPDRSLRAERLAPDRLAAQAVRLLGVKRTPRQEQGKNQTCGRNAKRGDTSGEATEHDRQTCGTMSTIIGQLGKVATDHDFVIPTATCCWISNVNISRCKYEYLL